MHRPKLRDNKNRKSQEPYQTGDIPDAVVFEISKHLVYNYAIGKKDIDGKDWGDIFALAIQGEHLSSPVGLADVVLDGMAWSVKSVKNTNPHTCQTVRIISGRNSPDYSYGITDPHLDVEKTGAAVLNIWNERVNIALDNFAPLRSSVLVRNYDKFEFLLFELELERFPPKNYQWQVNQNGNLEGYELASGLHKFTWQPHGSQFTVIHPVPVATKKFSVKKPIILDFENTLIQVGFDNSWVIIQ